MSPSVYISKNNHFQSRTGLSKECPLPQHLVTDLLLHNLSLQILCWEIFFAATKIVLFYLHLLLDFWRSPDLNFHNICSWPKMWNLPLLQLWFIPSSWLPPESPPTPPSPRPWQHQNLRMCVLPCCCPSLLSWLVELGNTGQLFLNLLGDFSCLALSDTQIDSIQCLNFAKKMIQFNIQFNTISQKFNLNNYLIQYISQISN